MKLRRPIVSELAGKRDHRANRLLAALEPEDLAYLAPHLEIVALPKGTILYQAGETLRYAYFPHDTIVSLVADMSNGSSAEMAVFGCESMVGLISAFVTRQSIGRYVVQFPGVASRICLDRMHEAINVRPSIRQLILRFTEALLSRILQNVACNAVHSVEARCCRWILSTHDRLNQDTLPLTHEFLAEMLGVQRSTVSIITRALQAEGLIQQGRGFIAVTDRSGLERASCECYGKVRRNFEGLLPHTYTKT
ncbi:Crp/Fnr family transcriptional regulator [Microvirga sp. GCM10011540]|uniref:Crp/Fnr family transcriptional regulator n=1 Tax=Microvirga sp. GCM10011540 TaxID=3317338 RepID=UPI0036213DDD